ncbi:hypothetical protein GCM10023184_17280 [Flaviaesturariibacter amylovorans]|uniref:Esterase-like activity of phytase family protein n=1 Tax=Flaviaesturariibacter amylovorans TaxID=1084520 RepID=A0ABP8GP46_9BACT
MIVPVLLATLAWRCSGEARPSLEVLSVEVLRDVPSGSALTVRGDSAYIVGDDATGIYHLALTGRGYRKLPLAGADISEYRIPRERKPDYEASAVFPRGNDLYLVAFGSGSKAPMRDSVLVHPLSGSEAQQSFPAAPFYSGLREQLDIPPGSWNIEGAALLGEDLYLFNRGTNTIIRCNAAQVLGFVTGRTTSLPAVDGRRLSLLGIKGREARISGASATGDGRIVFCASVEDTDDWTKDGPVLGSFIGIWDPRTGKLSSVRLLADAAGNPLVEKLESVDVLKRAADGQLELLAIGDNDDGTTRLLRLSYSAAD